MNHLALLSAALAACGSSSAVMVARTAPPLPALHVREADAAAYANHLGRSGRTLACRDHTCLIRFVVNEPPDRESNSRARELRTRSTPRQVRANADV
jgi:hypothetical protein